MASNYKDGDGFKCSSAPGHPHLAEVALIIYRMKCTCVDSSGKYGKNVKTASIFFLFLSFFSEFSNLNISVNIWNNLKPFILKIALINTYKMAPHLLSYLIRALRYCQNQPPLLLTSFGKNLLRKFPKTFNSHKYHLKWPSTPAN